MIFRKCILFTAGLIILFILSCNTNPSHTFIRKYPEISEFNSQDSNCAKFERYLHNKDSCKEGMGIHLSAKGDTIRVNGKAHTQEQFFTYLISNYGESPCVCLRIADDHLFFSSLYNAFANIYHNLELRGKPPKICWQGLPIPPNIQLPSARKSYPEIKVHLYVFADLTMRLNGETIANKEQLSKRIAELKVDEINMHFHPNLKVQDLQDIMAIGANQGVKMIMSTGQFSYPGQEI